jgi:hypothetical protein
MNLVLSTTRSLRTAQRRDPRGAGRFLAILFVVVVNACGDSPGGPGPIVNPPPVTNNPPVITSVTVQSARANAPADFADVGDSVAVTAVVTDAETPVETLQYNWTATVAAVAVGSFTGTGSRVTWVAPATIPGPAMVTVALEVVERFGTNQENRVRQTATIDLHDSKKEVGAMSEGFLTEFSKPQTNQNLRDIMKDFNAARCPDPREVEAEEGDVQRHYENFVMHSYTINPAQVTVNFGGVCAHAPGGIRGDACAAVSVVWNSTDKRNGITLTTRGTDLLTAAYSVTDRRWWLCSSRFQGTSSLGHSFYNGGR